MAGIGFRLRRMAEEQGLVGFFTGYSVAAAIMAGPWIMTVLTVLGVTMLSPDLDWFDAYITHVYQVSLITVGFFQFPATRYLADLLYKKEYRQVFPSFHYTLLICLGITSLIGAFWAFTTPGPPALERLIVVCLMNIVSAQWVSLVFLVTVHNYRAILGAFLVGGIVSIFSVNEYFGFNSNLDVLAGYTAGQALTLLILIGTLMSEYPAYEPFDKNCLVWLKRYPSLPLAGGLFYLGIFADKFAFRYGGWLSGEGIMGRQVLAPWLYMSEPYEFLTFLAQLTVIPALAVFYIRVETGFYEVYKAFYKGIDDRRTLEELKEIKQQILQEMKSGALAVASAQAVISLLCFLVAPELLPNQVLSVTNTAILRASIVAAFFAILLLLVIVLLLYFEFYREACFSAALYTVLNYTFTVLTILITSDLYGWGAALASCLAFLVAARILWVRVDDLLYQTFSKSPVETLPEKVKGIPGVGRYRVQKGELTC
ncbi:MAG: exopolysaccharide Pel transporter PelG [Candidatus Eremiobacteraeota bacterium]|nr:exopolysaccharide Pel transporter PelG [Candidatus Eremiobacteraeota bacterium]